MGEFAFIDWLRQRTPADPRVLSAPATTPPPALHAGGAVPGDDRHAAGRQLLPAGRGRSAAGRPQGDGGQPQRHRRDGGPAGRGRGQRRPAAPGRPGPGRGTLPAACARWPTPSTPPWSAATPTAGTARSSSSVTLLGEATPRGPVRAQRRPARRLAAGHRPAGRQHPRQAPGLHAARPRGAAACTQPPTCTP